MPNGAGQPVVGGCDLRPRASRLRHEGGCRAGALGGQRRQGAFHSKAPERCARLREADSCLARMDAGSRTSR